MSPAGFHSPRHALHVTQPKWTANLGVIWHYRLPLVRGEVPRGHRPQVALAGPEEPGIGAPALWHPLAATSPPACHHYLATILILRTVTMPVLPSPCYQTGVLHPVEGTLPPPLGALATVSNNTIKTGLLLRKHERDGRMGNYEILERQTSSITREMARAALTRRLGCALSRST